MPELGSFHVKLVVDEAREVIAPNDPARWHPGDVRSRGLDGQTYVHTASWFAELHRRVEDDRDA